MIDLQSEQHVSSEYGGPLGTHIHFFEDTHANGSGEIPLSLTIFVFCENCNLFKRFVPVFLCISRQKIA